MDVKKYIEDLVEGYLADKPDLFLVDVVVSGSNKKNKVLVLIDGDNGVSIDQCALLSRKLSAELEEKDIMVGAYRLEVSSPGVEFPLKFKRQYPKHIGRKVKVNLQDGSEKTGKLLELGDEAIKLEEEIKEGKKARWQEVEIKHDDIKNMIVLVSFK
jgi:ribosome maturation factor RimP